MVKRVRGYIYLKPPESAKTRWDIPRRVMRNAVEKRLLVGKPVILEHDLAHDPTMKGAPASVNTTVQIGQVVSASCHNDGSTHIEIDINDEDAIGQEVVKKIEAGFLRGLSLSHEKRGDDYNFLEVSVTRAPKREGTYMVIPPGQSELGGGAQAPVAASSLGRGDETDGDSDAGSETEGVVCCSEFECSFGANEYIPAQGAAPSSTQTPSTMSDAKMDPPAVASPATPVPVAAQADAKPDAKQDAPASAPAPAATDAKMADPPAAAPGDAPLEKPFEALAAVMDSNAKPEDKNKSMHVLLDVIEESKQAKADAERMKAELDRLKSESLTREQTRNHWAMLLASMAQNPGEREKAERGYKLLMQYENKPELNSVMETFVNTHNAVTNQLVSQVTKGDQSSRQLLMEVMKSRTAKRPMDNASSSSSSSSSASAMMRSPVAVVTSANSFGDMFNASMQQQQQDQKRKQQATSKTAPGPLMRAFIQEMANVVQMTMPGARDLTPVQANDLLHTTVAEYLTGKRAPFASLEEAMPMFALETLVLANATVNSQAASEIVSCSSNMDQFLGQDVQDQVEITDFTRRSTLIARNTSSSTKSGDGLKFQGATTGNHEIIFRHY